VVAVLIGGIEALALIADELDLKGGFRGPIGAASDNFGLLGYAVIGLFVVSWLGVRAVLQAQALRRHARQPGVIGDRLNCPGAQWVRLRHADDRVPIGRVAMMMSRVRSTRELCAENTPCRRHRTRPFHYQPLKAAAMAPRSVIR
jgi:hypothetical protein